MLLASWRRFQKSCVNLRRKHRKSQCNFHRSRGARNGGRGANLDRSFNPISTCGAHYEKRFTKNNYCPKILNRFTKFQFEEYFTNCPKIEFRVFLLKIRNICLNSLKFCKLSRVFEYRGQQLLEVQQQLSCHYKMFTKF